MLLLFVRAAFLLWLIRLTWRLLDNTTLKLAASLVRARDKHSDKIHRQWFWDRFPGIIFHPHKHTNSQHIM